jgi:hypothetical protein
MKLVQESPVRSPQSAARARRLWTVDCGLRFVLPTFLALQLMATSAPAAGQLQANLIPLGLRARNAAPIPVQARFNWDGTRILEGRLEMEFREGNRVLGRYQSDDLALAGGEQKFRMLLPPIPAPFSDSQVEVQMKFVTAGHEIALEPSVLFLPTVDERSLVVAWCASETSGGWQRSGIERNLLLEQFAPSSEPVSQRLLRTSVARLSPEDLPAQPLAYTPFDIVVLTADAFKEASERQLQALVRWVNGGGSACVYVGGGLQPHQIRFLNQLAESASGGPTFLADDAGNLLPARKEMLSLRSGLGRSVIVPEAAVEKLNADPVACRRAAAFLWRVRSSQTPAIAELGHWQQPANSPTRYNAFGRAQPPFRNGPYYAAPLTYSVQPSALGAELMSLLMPRTVRLIPFSSLLGMLVLFVLMIGPVDYFVLGFFRRRRLTWVLFPATSIAFLVATVLMANHYLGLRDQRTSLIVVDLAKDGTALRWNRYELVFAARDKQSVTELKDALWSPLNVQAMPGQFFNPYSPNGGYQGFNPGYPVGNPRSLSRGYNGYYPGYPPGYAYRAGAGGEVGPPLYDGVLPIHFQTREALRQWQPELNRTLSFGPPPVPMLPNWSAVEAAWPNLEAIRAKLSKKMPFDGGVYAISGAPSITAGPGSIGILPPPILQELCLGNARGLLSLVSQISPTGGSNFEDIQAMDPESSDSALVIVTRIGDDIVVYRRFFYGN